MASSDDSFYLLANVEVSSFNPRSYTADLFTSKGVKVGWVRTNEDDDATPTFYNIIEQGLFEGWCDSLSMTEVCEILFHNHQRSLV